MRKIFILILFLLFLSNSYSQTKIKDSYFYGGLGTSLIIFTNSDVSSIYPVMNTRSSSFLTDVNITLGYKLNKNYAVEFNPSFTFTNMNNGKGFTFYNGVNNYFYLPNGASLFAMPLNLKFKTFPFAQKSISFANGIYCGLGGGMMYIKEEYDNIVYPNSQLSSNPLYYQSASTNLWKPNLQLCLGFDLSGKFSYGFEAGYRFVPLATNGTQPVVTSVASNFNSVYLTVKAGFGFY